MSDLISRSDAIGAVKEERFPIDSDYAEGFMAALDKVEWILKEWLPSAQPDSKETSSTHKALDTISRQAAMEEISKQQTYKMFDGEDTLYLDANDVGSVLASLPSAQPETHEERTETHACDCISRKAAIDDVCHMMQECFESDEEELDAIKTTINELPSAERKKGKWIDTTQGDHYKCSCCGTIAAFWFNEENSSGWEKDMSEWLSDYCPKLRC